MNPTRCTIFFFISDTSIRPTTRMVLFQTTSTPATDRSSENLSLSEQAPEGHAEQNQYAEHHSGGVGVDKAGLDFAYLSGNRANQFGGAVDDAVVDNRGIADFPEEVAQCARAFGEDVEIQGVEVVFVFKQNVNRTERLRDFGGQVRQFDVQKPCAQYACDSEVEDGRMQAVRHHCQCAVELFFHDVHGRMRVGIDENHLFEEIAVEHGFDGDVADDDGRNGKQNQRQGNDQRAFVRIVVFAQAVMFFAMVV